MGIINAENTLKFKSSQILFDRIKKRLSSFDAQGLIDDGDFYKHVKYILEQLGQAVYKECEAVVHVKHKKTKLPNNFYMFHAAFKCTPFFNNQPPSINEQKPIIYYTDTEVTQVCPNKCCIECVGNELGKTKIVIRTFVNGEEHESHFRNPILLRLSPNVKVPCTEDCLSLLPSAKDEITIDDNHTLHAHFEDGSIYLQYYGLPFDENELPMIPDNEDIERAIEYYIYTQLFEEFYWNSTVPNIAPMLQDVRAQYDRFYLPQARYWAKLPSFQKMVESIRRSRNRKKFYYMAGDRTIAAPTSFGYGSGFRRS